MGWSELPAPLPSQAPLLILPRPRPATLRPTSPVLRHMARIGDFREAFLCPDLITAHGAQDGVGFIRWVLRGVEGVESVRVGERSGVVGWDAVMSDTGVLPDGALGLEEGRLGVCCFWPPPQA